MEDSHQRVIEEMQRQHQREVERLTEERERVLQEETNATIAGAPLSISSYSFSSHSVTEGCLVLLLEGQCLAEFSSSLAQHTYLKV